MTSYTDVMDRVDDMKPIDAVNYLLGIVADLAPAVLGIEHKVDHWGIRFSPSERLVICALVDAAPRWLSYDQLDAITQHQGNPDLVPAQSLSKVYVCKVRRKMGRNHGKIETMWGRGYRYIPPIDGAMLS